MGRFQPKARASAPEASSELRKASLPTQPIGSQPIRTNVVTLLAYRGEGDVSERRYPDGTLRSEEFTISGGIRVSRTFHPNGAVASEEYRDAIGFRCNRVERVGRQDVIVPAARRWSDDGLRGLESYRDAASGLLQDPIPGWPALRRWGVAGEESTRHYQQGGMRS